MGQLVRKAVRIKMTRFFLVNSGSAPAELRGQRTQLDNLACLQGRDEMAWE